MPSFRSENGALHPSQEKLPAGELNALNLLKKFTGDRNSVDIENAYLKLGILRAMQMDLEEYNSTFDGAGEQSLAAYCQARVVEVLSSIGLVSGKPVDLDDLMFLIKAIETFSEERLAASRERINAGKLEFLDLAELYKPGTRVVGPAGGMNQEMGFFVRSCHFDTEKSMFRVVKHSFHLELEFFASVGDQFGAVRCQEQVGWWRGLRDLAGLFYRPLSDDVERRLTERGGFYSQVATGQRFLTCRKGSFVTGRARNSCSLSDSRVMVDVVAAMESGQKPVLSGHADAAPNAMEVQTEYYRKASRQGRLDKKKDPAVQKDEVAGVLVIDRMVFFAVIPQSRLWNCWPTVLAYSFSSRSWGHAEVGGLSEIVWEEDSWASLVLPTKRKALIKAVVEKQAEVGSIDVIKGKGEGTTFLLYGSPGTGKTLTAEALAEVLHKPLYVLSAGDLGTSPQDLELALTTALQLCARWDCICLVDEADIFLEQRKNMDVVRNALVCIMLRQLEYHPGVLFMTTNRVKGIDPAVQSRLTLALKYEPLGKPAREEIWKNLLKRLEGGPFDFGVLAEPSINGRQIKNCVRLSLALALHQGVALSQEILADTLETVCTFQQDLEADA